MQSKRTAGCDLSFECSMVRIAFMLAVMDSMPKGGAEVMKN
jgi:hypothetical protein